MADSRDKGNRRPSRTARAQDRDTEERKLDRALPANTEAEEGLLASCIMDGGQEIVTACIEAKLRPEYFLKPAHQIIFEAILTLYNRSSEIDEIILANELENMGQLETIGGYAAISKLTNRIETTAHARYWLDIVREKALLRRLIKASTEAIDKAFNSTDGLDVLLEQAEQSIFSISQDRISDSAKHVKDSVDSAVALVNKMISRKGELAGVPSGFKDLDAMTFGFHPQEMIVLAARPSVGKTSFAMNVAESIVLPKDPSKAVPTLVFSLEMGADQLAMRLLCSHSRVNMKRLKDGFMSKEEQKALAQSAQLIKTAPLWIDDSGQITILEMRAKARRLAAKHQLGMIIVDYLQLISGTDSRVAREQQIAEISRGMKAMAKELNLPVIVLSQLNRDSEKERRPPRLSDLRESGSIEQDADVVIMLARTISTDDKNPNLQDTGQRDLIIAKQRNGPIGNVTLTFIPELTRFENYTNQNL